MFWNYSFIDKMYCYVIQPCMKCLCVNYLTVEMKIYLLLTFCKLHSIKQQLYGHSPPICIEPSKTEEQDILDVIIL